MTEYEVSTKHSRLYHTQAIAARAKGIIENYLACDRQVTWDRKVKNIESPARGTKNFNARHTLFIRAENDQFEISLDASGDLLHKRGIKKNVGKAPLRENIAFAMFSAAGYSGKESLLDPMCGSGTFSIEGCMIKENIPPGFFRKFAFEQWPCFSQARWNHIKKKAEKAIIPTKNTTLFASDIDNKMLASLEKSLNAHNLNASVKVFNKNFFDLNPDKLTEDKGLIVLNPPYGKRIGDDLKVTGDQKLTRNLKVTRKINIESFFAKIGKHLKENFKGWRAGIVLPDKDLLSTLPFSASLTPVFHGGLEIFIATGKIT
ncbi:MAG: hypothetical protein U9N77_11290 [Thermodesulfobacteriota bacterium]|nr:hypothetical protein [Thermodesulfobacteriota bacterium]